MKELITRYFGKSVLKNFLALGLVQATNFIIPLITFPYLVRTVGLEKFGVISYGLTILTYLISLSDYGFNLSATRQVAMNGSDNVALSKLFNKVMTTKLMLFFVSMFIMFLCCIFIDRFNKEFPAYTVGMLFVLGNVLMPTWFFQGIEQMKYITFANVIAKVIQLALLFVVVKVQSDYVFVLGLYGVANIASGIYSITVAIKEKNINLGLASITEVKEQIREGWHYFTSTISVTVATNTNIILLGFFVSNSQIGYYSISEKIVFIAWTILSMYSQSIYPTVCRIADESFDKVNKYVWKATTPIILLTALGCIFIQIFAPEIIKLITGQYDNETIQVLRYIIVVPFIVSLNIPANQMLLAFNYKKAYSNALNCSAISNILIGFVLIRLWGVMGAVSTMIIIQIFITLSLNFLIYSKKGKIAFT